LRALDEAGVCHGVLDGKLDAYRWLEIPRIVYRVVNCWFKKY
jgi:hypothetical protein